MGDSYSIKIRGVIMKIIKVIPTDTNPNPSRNRKQIPITIKKGVKPEKEAFKEILERITAELNQLD